jgi:hypothetical protein
MFDLSTAIPIFPSLSAIVHPFLFSILRSLKAWLGDTKKIQPPSENRGEKAIPLDGSPENPAISDR